VVRLATLADDSNVRAGLSLLPKAGLWGQVWPSSGDRTIASICTLGANRVFASTGGIRAIASKHCLYCRLARSKQKNRQHPSWMLPVESFRRFGAMFRISSPGRWNP
jgi:hypothetical protein